MREFEEKIPWWQRIAQDILANFDKPEEEEKPVYDEDYFKRLYDKIQNVDRPHILTDPNKTLTKATSIGAMKPALPPPPTRSGEFLRDNPTVANIFESLGGTLENAEPGGKAGLPFAAYKASGKLPVPFLSHGTYRPPFDFFDPSTYDVNDVLGWMTHNAEHPIYSGGYALGTQKGNLDKLPKTGPFTSEHLQTTDWKTGKRYKAAPRVIPIEPKAENTLDLVDPNPDDMSAAIAALGPNDRKRILQQFKTARQMVRDVYPGTTPKELAQRLGIDPRHLLHRGEELTFEELPVRLAAEKLRLSPKTFGKTQFDAIRYNDMAQKSWAFPADTPLETPWGVPLNKPAKPLKVTRLPYDAPTTSVAEVTPERRTLNPELPSTPPPTGGFEWPDSLSLTEDELLKYNYVWSEKLKKWLNPEEFKQYQAVLAEVEKQKGKTLSPVVGNAEFIPGGAWSPGPAGSDFFKLPPPEYDSIEDLAQGFAKGEIDYDQYKELQYKFKQAAKAAAKSPVEIKPAVPHGIDPESGLSYGYWNQNEEGIPTIFGMPMNEAQLDFTFQGGMMPQEQYDKAKQIFAQKKANAANIGKPGFDSQSNQFKPGVYVMADNFDIPYTAEFFTPEEVQSALQKNHLIKSYTTPPESIWDTGGPPKAGEVMWDNPIGDTPEGVVFKQFVDTFNVNGQNIDDIAYKQIHQYANTLTHGEEDATMAILQNPYVQDALVDLQNKAIKIEDFKNIIDKVGNEVSYASVMGETVSPEMWAGKAGPPKTGSYFSPVDEAMEKLDFTSPANQVDILEEAQQKADELYENGTLTQQEYFAANKKIQAGENPFTEIELEDVIAEDKFVDDKWSKLSFPHQEELNIIASNQNVPEEIYDDAFEAAVKGESPLEFVKNKYPDWEFADTQTPADKYFSKFLHEIDKNVGDELSFDAKEHMIGYLTELTGDEKVAKDIFYSDKFEEVWNKFANTDTFLINDFQGEIKALVNDTTGYKLDPLPEDDNWMKMIDDNMSQSATEQAAGKPTKEQFAYYSHSPHETAEEIIKKEDIPLFPGMDLEAHQEAISQANFLMEKGYITEDQYHNIIDFIDDYIYGENPTLKPDWAEEVAAKYQTEAEKINELMKTGQGPSDPYWSKHPDWATQIDQAFFGGESPFLSEWKPKGLSTVDAAIAKAQVLNKTPGWNKNLQEFKPGFYKLENDKGQGVPVLVTKENQKKGLELLQNYMSQGFKIKTWEP